MRVVLITISLFIWSQTIAQTISVRSIEPTKKNTVILPKYDTTFVHLNIDKLYNNLHYYDGQKILFSPNIDNNTFYSHYTNFFIQDSVELFDYPDTIWIKKRKKVKPGDFYTTYPKTITYKPEYVSDGIVRTVGDDIYINGMKRRKGFFTPCQYIDGQEFYIKSVSLDISGQYKFHLIDKENNEVYFLCSKPSIKQSKDSFTPSILLLSFIDKYKLLYVGKQFHAKDVSEYSKVVYLFRDINTGEYVPVNGDLLCIDISLVRGRTSYARLGNEDYSVCSTDVRLFFRDNNNKEFCIPIENSYNFSLTLTKDSYKNYDYSKRYYHIQLDNMILATDYYAQKEAMRLAEQQKQIEDQQAKQERKLNLIKKFGKERAEQIFQHKVQIGMTADMCREAWGEPDNINRTTGSWGVHEQWCYDWGGYLYIENGKLAAIQN